MSLKIKHLTESHKRIRYSSIDVSCNTCLDLSIVGDYHGIFKWKQNLLLKEKIKGNPYKLVVDILLFALRHKSPLRRSVKMSLHQELTLAKGSMEGCTPLNMRKMRRFY